MRYELVEGSSAKFWDITVTRATVTVTFGRIGSTGQTKSTKFASEEVAVREADKLVREKVKKGYKKVGKAPSKKVTAVKASSPRPAAPKSRSTSAGSAKKKLVFAKRGDEIVASLAGSEVRFRYVELSREKEAVEPDEEDDEDAVEAYERENARVTCELYANVPEVAKGLPRESFVRLVFLYTRDSYDGNYALVLEEGRYYRPAWKAVRVRLGGISNQEILRQLAPRSPYPEALTLAAKSFAEDEWFDEEENEGDAEPTLLRAPEPKASRGARPAEPKKTGKSDSLVEASTEVQAARKAGESLWYAKAAPAENPHLSKAIRLFKDAPPENANAWVDLLATTETDTRDAKGLAHVLEGAAKRHPKSVEIQLALACAYQRGGEDAKAIKVFGELLKKQPTAHVHFLRGLSFTRAGNRDRAAKDLDAAVKLGPEDARYYAARPEARAANCSFVFPEDKERGHADANRAIELQPIADHFYLRADFRNKAEGYSPGPAELKLVLEDVTRAIALATEGGDTGLLIHLLEARGGWRGEKKGAQDVAEAERLRGDDGHRFSQERELRRWRRLQAPNP